VVYLHVIGSVHDQTLQALKLANLPQKVAARVSGLIIRVSDDMWTGTSYSSMPHESSETEGPIVRLIDGHGGGTNKTRT
jgi:hypothetical protein